MTLTVLLVSSATAANIVMYGPMDLASLKTVTIWTPLPIQVLPAGRTIASRSRRTRGTWRDQRTQEWSPRSLRAVADAPRHQAEVSQDSW